MTPSAKLRHHATQAVKDATGQVFSPSKVLNQLNIIFSNKLRLLYIKLTNHSCCCTQTNEKPSTAWTLIGETLLMNGYTFLQNIFNTTQKTDENYGIRDILPSSKYAPCTDQQTFVALNKSGMFLMDPRQSGSKMVKTKR